MNKKPTQELKEKSKKPFVKATKKLLTEKKS